ncbi:MAG: hypothetical protein IPO81_01960 [Kouleothrix sp.]|nr:hypothetical protein [Kouleothrix sp.]
MDTEFDRFALRRECLQEVRRLQEQRDWRLLPAEQWSQLVLEQITAGATATPVRIAIHVYSQAMHRACSGAEGGERQNRAYSELFRYIYDLARSRYPDIAEDAAQHAVERTFILFAHCRLPGAFLAFAHQQLLDATRSQRRQDNLFGWSRVAGGTLDLLRHPDQRQADPITPIIEGELRARFERLSEEFLRKHPRATQQLRALRLKYIDGLDDETISRLLDKPVNSIYVLRSRALEKLRAEPAWRALAVEFGILPDE